MSSHSYPPIEDTPTVPVPVQKPRRRRKAAWWVGGTLAGFVAIGAVTGDPDTQNAASVAPASTPATTTSAAPTTTTSATATTSATPTPTTTSAGVAAGAGVGAGVGINVPNARTSTRRATPTTTRKPAPPKTTAQRTTAKKTTEKPVAAYYKNCAAVRAAGKAPIRRGQPGYASHLDRDGDGIGCE